MVSIPGSRERDRKVGGWDPLEGPEADGATSFENGEQSTKILCVSCACDPKACRVLENGVAEHPRPPVSYNRTALPLPLLVM